MVRRRTDRPYVGLSTSPIYSNTVCLKQMRASSSCLGYFITVMQFGYVGALEIPEARDMYFFPPPQPFLEYVCTTHGRPPPGRVLRFK